MATQWQGARARSSLICNFGRPHDLKPLVEARGIPVGAPELIGES